MRDSQIEETVLPIEIFAAKDSGELMMSVPWQCGLQDGDTLRIDGLALIAMRERSVLPVDLPALSEDWKTRLVAWARQGKPLPVGEFLALGLANAYFLNLDVT